MPSNLISGVAVGLRGSQAAEQLRVAFGDCGGGCAVLHDGLQGHLDADVRPQPRNPLHDAPWSLLDAIPLRLIILEQLPHGAS